MSNEVDLTNEKPEVVEETTVDRVSLKVIQVNSTVSVTRKIPLEQYGSVDFFSSQGCSIAIEHPEGMPIKELYVNFIDPVRDQAVRLNMRKAMEDVSYQILVIRAIRDGMSAGEATTMAREQITKLPKTLNTLAKGAQG